MNIKLLFLICLTCLGLSSCNKEVEQYESKNIQVDSVFNKTESQSQENQNQQNQQDQTNNKQDEKAQQQTQQQANPASQTNQKKFKTVDTTNLRRNPTTNDEVLVSVPASVEIEVIQEVNSENEVWIKTKYNNSEGFIRKDLLEEINN